MSVKRVVALVVYTVLHSRFARVWCLLRKRVDEMSANVGRREVKTSLIQIWALLDRPNLVRLM